MTSSCQRCGSALEATNDFSLRRCSSCGHEQLALYSPPVSTWVPPPAQPDRPSRALAVTTVVLLSLNAVSSAFGIASNAVALHSHPGILADEEDYVDPDKLWLLLASGLQAVAAFILYVSAVIVFCIWLRRVNSSLRNQRFLTFTPGWAVGWWFIPFANLYKPYEMMVELWRATDPSRGDDWRFGPRSKVLPVWWAFWLLAGLVDNLAGRLSWRASTEHASETALQASIVGDFVGIPAAVLAAWIVWTIQRRAEQTLGKAELTR
jgi:hypothetical protein